jgi:hypothetical protein
MLRTVSLVARVVLSVFLAGVCLPQAAGINIILEPLSATTHPQILDGTFIFDEEPPAFDPASAGLQSILQHIESVYEDAFEDPQTIRITYWWDADMTFCCGQSIPAMMREDANGNLTHAVVRINPTVAYYIDPTPANDSEYTMAQRLYNYGPNAITPAQQAARFTGAVPAVFEAGYNGPVNPAGPAGGGLRDLLTLAFQEMGHSIGMNAGFTGVTNGSNTGEVDDGDYDVAPNLVNGAVMAMLPRGTSPDPLDHLVGIDAVMGNLSIGSERTRPSTADFLAIAAAQNWTQIDLPRKDFLGGASWHTDGNWLGGMRPLSNDAAYVRHGGTVTLGGVGNVESLEIDNNSVVETSNQMLVADQVNVVNTQGVGAPRLHVELGGTLTSEDVTVNAGTRLDVDGTANIDRLNIAGGQLRGRGMINMTDFLGVLVNDGSIVTSSGGTLTIQSANNLGVDLDGASEDGVVIVDQGNLFVDPLLTDAFNSDITITGGRTATFDSGATVGAGGLVRLNGASAGAATIAGGPLFLQSSGVISADGVGTVANAAIFLATGSISEAVDPTDEVRFNGDTFLSGGRILGTGVARQNGRLFASQDTDVEIATYDLDGLAGNTVGTVSPGVELHIQSAAIETGGDNDFDGTLNVNNGTLNIDSAWRLDGTLNLNGTTEGGGAHDDGGSDDTPNDVAVLEGAGGFALANGGRINVTGQALVDTSASIDNGLVFVDGDAEFSGPSIFGVNADVEIDDADDTLRLRGQTVLIGPSVVGSGRIIFEDSLNIAFFDTSIGCAETDRDGLLGDTEVLINQGLRFSIASITIEPTASDGFDGVINNRGEFSVLAGWRLDGRINMDAIGATVPEVDGVGPFRIHTSGIYDADGASRILSPLQVAGTVDASGGVTEVNNTASFESTANVLVGAGAELELNGATTLAGGSYTGPGIIQFNAATNVTAPTTISVGRVDLDGGAGTTQITLSGAPLVLNVGGVDVINDLFDGVVDANGAAAKLEVNLPGANDFWTVGSAGVVDLAGAALGPLSVMLDGSNVTIAGDLLVSGQVALGANVTLTGELQTANIVTNAHFASGGQNFIDSSATVGGTGDVVVDNGTQLNLEDNVLIGIDVENAGRVEVGYLPAIPSIDLTTPGDATIRGAFSQNAVGTFGVDLGGLLPGSQHDQLNVVQTATLAGSIQARLLEGFTPVLGQSFTVLTAGSVVGQFATLLQPVGMPFGLMLDDVYTPTSVQLIVVQGPIYSADFDKDGDVDDDDLGVWQASFGMNADADADMDGDSDGADLAIWQQQLGSGTAVQVNSAVPEPTAAVLMLTMALAAGARRRRALPSRNVPS